MKPVFLIGAVLAAVISVAAIAFASGGGDDGSAAQVPTATPPATGAPDPAAPPADQDGSPVIPAPQPDPADASGGTGGPDTVDSSAPIQDPDKPIPSEPPFHVPAAPPASELPPGRYALPAPIDGLDVNVAESFPPQYFLHVQAGLPSGCAEQYTHSVSRTGNLIEVEVLNSFPEGSPMCTAIYGMYELNIALGSDFTPGETYTVSVNGGEARTEFTAQ